MSIFTQDTSIQLSGNSSLTKTYNTKDNPNLAFHSRAGIYNSADNTIKIFTNNIDALTIDANQKVTCDGSLITNLTWGNINGKPTNFQSDWNSTIINKPSLFDGTWTSLSGKPTNFQSDWNSTIINKPSLFDGTWTSLSGKPTNFQADWNSTIINKPSLFDGTWTSLSGKPTNFQSDWNSTIINKPTLFDGTWTSLSGKPTNFQADWNSTVINKPTLFSGNYDDLTDKTFINSGTDIYNNNTGNVGIGITNPTAKLHVKGDLRCETVFSTLLTSLGNLFSNKPPWAMYFADDYDSITNTLYDTSGNNRHATTTGTITKTAAIGNGATAPITYISGDTSATISFPTGSIPTAFTILGLTRYNGGLRRRILQSRTSGVNWLLGHYLAVRGIAYFVNNYYTDAGGIDGNQDDWLCSIAKSSGTVPSNILMNGIQKGAGMATTTGGYELAVNIGINEKSDWALSTVMIWNSALTDAEMVLLNTAIDTYKSTGNPIINNFSRLFFTSEIYSFNNSYFNAEIFKNNINISNIFVTSNVIQNSSNLINYYNLSNIPNLNLKQDVISVSNPLTKIGNTIGLSYDSTLTLNGTQLSVASSASSQWTTSGTNIYNNNTGNVGVNVSAPRQKLDIYGGNAVIRATGEGGSAILYLGTPFNSTSSGFKSAIIAEGITSWSRSKLHFCMENTATDAPNATVSNSRMTILSDGNVGINLTTPQQKLSVAGVIESTNANSDKIYLSYDSANGYRHRINTTHDAGATDNNSIQFYNWRYGQTSTTVGDKSVAIFHNKYTRFDGNRYFWINDVNSVITGYDHSTAPLTIFHKTATSASVLNDSLPILNLAREGTGGQAWGARANFNICRWEHAGTSSVGSRTRLDLNLAHDAYDNINIMTWRSDGRVAINTTIPVSRFTIKGDYSAIDNNFCLDASDNAGVNNKYNFKIYPYVIGAGQVGYKIRVISNTTNITDALTFSDVGNVCIGNITPSYKLQIEDGSVFLGDSAYVSAGLATANGYKLIFDNTYNSAAGSGNICNKILLHNTSTFNAGFGIESGALVYQSGDSHSFYTGTTPSAYGTRRMLLSSTGNLNINADNNAYTRLNVNGVVSINGGTNYSAYNNQLLAGALSIGNLNTNYGGASGWSTNTAGLLMECLNNTEIVILDSGEYLISALYYVGGSSKYIEYGRAMGYGHPNGHYFKCNQTFECYFANAVGGWNYFKVEPTSLWGDGLSTASDQNGTKYLTMRNLMFQNPHVVPASVGGNAYIRYGRAGGVSSGTWWETGTRTDGRFHIAREATYFSSSMIIKPNGNSAFGNENPYDDPSAPNSYQFLHLGNSAIANVCDWNLVIHKSNGGGGTRNFAMGYDSSFYETIGDNGNNNQGSGNWLSHLSMSYAAPDYSLQLLTNGNFIVYGTISSGSDIKIKKNVRTIDNALWKVQQLRGVYYTHVIEETKNIGLIAQEVEGIIPEVVNYNDRTDMKGVNYANLTALLINAIKEQQEMIEAQNDRISKIEEILYNLINKE